MADVKCPICQGKVIPNYAGRAIASINGFLQHCFNLRIPTELLQYLQSKIPVNKQDIFKDKCAACDNKRTIKDPSDDRSKWEAAKSIAQSREPDIRKEEAKLGSTAGCGNRYTIIAGCDLLEVGLGMNDAPSYRVDDGKSISGKGLLDTSKIKDPKKSGPIPEGAKRTHVQGINSLASPGGHYMIKCSNKFSVLAGAQGVDITTGGPLTISAGITRITGPEVSIGTSRGKLLLEGEVVHINGKSVEVAPSDGHLFVRGTISNTGNIMTMGHMHAESATITKLATTGRNEVTKPAAATDLTVGPAFWGGLGVEGIPLVLKDFIAFIIATLTNPVLAQQAMSRRYIAQMMDKIQNITYMIRPIELKPTGIALYGIVYNFPHTHPQPDDNHTHEVRVPDIDYTAESAGDLRGKAAGASGSAPLNVSSAKQATILDALWSVISMVFAGPWSALTTNLWMK